MKRNKPLIFILKIITLSMILFSVLFSAMLFLPLIAGLKPYRITSSSMTPTLKKGDVIYDRRMDADTLEEGDIITFILPDSNVLVTHRILQIDKANALVYTIGDRNSSKDRTPIRYEDIVGIYSGYKLPIFSLFS